MGFNNFRFVVLCDGLFEAGFYTKAEAQDYLAKVSRAQERIRVIGLHFSIWITEMNVN